MVSLLFLLFGLITYADSSITQFEIVGVVQPILKLTENINRNIEISSDNIVGEKIIGQITVEHNINFNIEVNNDSMSPFLVQLKNCKNTSFNQTCDVEISWENAVEGNYFINTNFILTSML